MKPNSPRPRSARGPLIRRAATGTWDGTAEIVEAVVSESRGVAAWRPVRAAALLALAAPPEGHVWMTTEEFERWLKANFPPFSHGVAERLREEVGITPTRRATMQNGGRITKVEALACAHYATGLLMPISAGDSDTFSAWLTERFGAVRAISEVLEVSQNHIPCRMKGFIVHAGARLARTPEPDLIRALDWCWRVGPFCPYGQRLPADPFPRTKEA